MKFGFTLVGLNPRHYPSVALAAEAAGFESVWIPDHLVFPDVMPATYLYTESGEPPMNAATPVYDPWVLLGAIASATNTIRMGINVYVLPLRHPVITARAALTVDRISHGRMILGVGVGWLKDEFDIVGEDPGNRGRRTDEIIPLMRRLWSEDVITHDGEYYQLPPVRFEPKPYQQPIPIEIGGTSPAALRRAGRLGDGWIYIGSGGRDPDGFRAQLAVVQQARTDAGRADAPFIVTGGFGSDLASIRLAADLGVDRVIFGPGLLSERPSEQLYLDAVHRFADEVISNFA